MEQKLNGFWIQENSVYFLVIDRVCTFQELNSEVLWQFFLHLLFDDGVSVSLIPMQKLHIMSDLLLQFTWYFHRLHVGINDDHLRSKFILTFPSPQNNLHDLVHHITIHNKSKTKHNNAIVCLNGVQWGNISVRYCWNCIYSPI